MKAPTFTLLDQDGQTHSLSDYSGKKVLLYFYPKDDTPGCTKEACGFRDSLNDLQDKGVQVIGVSCDDVESHKKFAEKFHLNFPLLADTDRTVVAAYGVWKEKSMYGRLFHGINRESFLIDESGTIIKHYTKVHSSKHPEEVLKDISSL
jgi:thioredoxin-dependent peroxiredoxin